MIDVNNLIDITVDGVDTKDYPDFCDAYIDSAVWKDSGKDLTDEELDELNDEEREFVYEQVWDSIF